ncbi:MAG: RNA polymerase sigma factor [Bryobacterales bacterium]|nr:RNA polymerase sigma factor [Bryobacterales bacterium]
MQRREIELAARMCATPSPGFEESFEQFAQSIRQRLLQYSLIVCGQREDAEEVAQETLLAAYRDFANLRDPERVHAWFFRIARNSCLMRRRSENAARHDCHALPDATPSPPPEPDQIVMETEAMTRLARAIAGLPEDSRMVVMLRGLEGLSTKESAQVLGISEDAVRARLHRARLLLRSKL